MFSSSSIPGEKRRLPAAIRPELEFKRRVDRDSARSSVASERGCAGRLIGSYACHSRTGSSRPGIVERTSLLAKVADVTVAGGCPAQAQYLGSVIAACESAGESQADHPPQSLAVAVEESRPEPTRRRPAPRWSRLLSSSTSSAISIELRYVSSRVAALPARVRGQTLPRQVARS